MVHPKHHIWSSTLEEKKERKEEGAREQRPRPKPEEKPAKQSPQHPKGKQSQERQIEDSEKKAFIVRKLKILAVTLHYWWPNNKDRD